MSSKTIKGCIQLTCIGLFIWFFFWIFTPWWVSFSPVHQRFGEVADENDISVDALYYTDVPITQDAERLMRDVWLNRKNEAKKKAALEKNQTPASTTDTEINTNMDKKETP